MIGVAPTRTQPGSGLGRRRYFAEAKASASRDFLRLALALWITPDLAALSSAELKVRNASLVFCLSPPLAAVSNARSRVFRRDATLRLWRRLRSLLRARRSADFVFGIVLCPLLKSSRKP